MNTTVNIKEIPCASAVEYLENLNKLAYGADVVSENNWLFRGQNKAEHLLMPSIFRNCNQGYQSIFDKIHGKILPEVADLSAAIKNHINCLADKHGGKIKQQHKARLIEIIKSTFVEVELVERFLLICNRAGLYVPSIRLFNLQPEEEKGAWYLYCNLSKIAEKFISINDDLTLLSNVLGEFPYLFHHKSLIDFDCPDAVALARHHGIPTRFLDWTENPLYAAFFSAYDAKKDGISVWAINTAYMSEDYNYGAIRFHKKLKQQGLEFLHRQRGLFTEMMGADAYYFYYGQWPTLDQYLLKTYEANADRIYLKKFILNGKDKISDLVCRLEKAGVNRPELMPTHDNMANHILKNFVC